MLLYFATLGRTSFFEQWSFNSPDISQDITSFSFAVLLCHISRKTVEKSLLLSNDFDLI